MCGGWSENGADRDGSTDGGRRFEEGFGGKEIMPRRLPTRETEVQGAVPWQRSFFTRVAARQMVTQVTSSSYSRGKTEEWENLELPPLSGLTMTRTKIEDCPSAEQLRE